MSTRSRVSRMPGKACLFVAADHYEADAGSGATQDFQCLIRGLYDRRSHIQKRVDRNLGYQTTARQALLDIGVMPSNFFLVAALVFTKP